MRYKKRRTLALLLFVLISVFISLSRNTVSEAPVKTKQTITAPPPGAVNALSAADELPVKTRAAHYGYSRDEFLSDWGKSGNCDMRNLILSRDMDKTFVDPSDGCKVIRGELNDPYTGRIIEFQRGFSTSEAVQIDHVVALSDAWQTGAQGLSADDRNRLANDPLNLLAVDGPANQEKSDGDASEWLPPNIGYRCRYVARQIAVKLKYHLWLTSAEKDAIERQLRTCPDQVLPIEASR
ncbi:MAG TPA: HNH endonuclease family protein [Candidatus Saccharimonadales bacterium]|nr:HNH endonuclease family protein [Candidatus Saccharimonadales bacterium]